MESDEIMEQSIAGKAVTAPAMIEVQDPYHRLVKLMVVVEVFCHKWPERQSFRRSDIFLL